MQEPRFSSFERASAEKLLAHHDFRPDINGLRALAVLSVLGFHAGLPFTPGGFAGVDIFFVISGFLISRIILSERVAGGFSLLDFYGKRVRRILPALLLVLFASWAASWFLLEPAEFRRFGGHMEGSSYFTVNLWLLRQGNGPGAYFLPDSRYFPLLHLWSLSIEEQFYLLWPAILLVLLRFKRAVAPGVAVIFVISLVYCIVLTGQNSTAAFYSLTTRAWELALGAFLAQREVFSLSPGPSSRAADFRAGLGVILMLLSVIWLLDEAAPWPGFLALVPTVGAALVIAAPGSRISQRLLGNGAAQYFGRISYPLYLWHWPLFSLAHNRYGDDLPSWLAVLLALAAIALADLTWRLVERPIAAAYKRKPLAVAAPLLVGLALAGVLGSATRRSEGFPQRFPAEVALVANYSKGGAEGAPDHAACWDDDVSDHAALPAARRKTRAFFAAHNCAKVADPGKPTIIVVGDSHARHLLTGLEAVYGERANIRIDSALGCAPMIAETKWRVGVIGSPRCQAFNEQLIGDIVAIKPAAIVIASYYAEFYTGAIRYFPDFLSDLDANIAALRKQGVMAPIVVLGQVPTWSPGVPTLVARELLSGQKPSEFSFSNLKAEGRNIDALFAAHAWGKDVSYVSQYGALCDARGCRRFVGPRLPEDMIDVDYGHYSAAGSIYAVRNILEPVLDPILARAPAK
ncbi:acyltransferase family protein [Rhodoblastus sp.]|uniref:acyltransferase family protein n=1 Tax=Rhodoblastus sp. TaxID=1962975 RepID=UPI00262054DE|nr:acyltransferase family protein [Rhodoblastus sp.]